MFALQIQFRFHIHRHHTYTIAHANAKYISIAMIPKITRGCGGVWKRTVRVCLDRLLWIHKNNNTNFKCLFGLFNLKISHINYSGVLQLL